MKPLWAALFLCAWLVGCVAATDAVTPQKASRWGWAPSEKWRI